MRFRRTSILTCLAAAALLLAVPVPASAAAKAKAAKPDPAATLIIGGASTTVIATWDSELYPSGQSNFTNLTAAYDRLLQLDVNNQIKPMLATSYKWDSTNTQLTFSLRKDVKFWDGAAFNAAVAVQNIKRLLLPGGLGVSTLSKMTDVSAVDEFTVKLTFSTPDPAVIYVFSNIAGMQISPNALANPSSLVRTPVGSGPYKFVEVGADLTYKYDRNDNYWNKDFLYAAHMQIPNIVDENARLNAVRTGVIDYAYITSLTYPQAKTDTSIQTAAQPSYSPYVIYMNSKLAPLDNVQVRSAVAMALNRPAFNAAQSGLCTPWSQSIPPGVDGYDKSISIKYDVTAAKKIVTDTGAGNTKIQLIQGNIEPNNSMSKIAQAQLQAIGLNVELVPMASTLFRAAYRAGTYGMLLAPLAAGISPDPTSYIDLFGTGTDQPGPKDPTLQAMVDKARVNPLGSKERKTAFVEINKYMTEKDLYWAPICQAFNTFTGTKRLMGLTTMPNSQLSQAPDNTYMQIAKAK